MSKKIIVILGASGSGKDTILGILKETYGFRGVVSYTARPPRKNETNGVDYHFISKKEFAKRLEEGFFAENTFYANNPYGFAREDLIEGVILIACLDGLRQLRNELDLELFVVYVSVREDVRTLRLYDRGDNPEEINRRIKSDKIDFRNASMEVDFILTNNTDDIEDLKRSIRMSLIPAIKQNV